MLLCLFVTGQARAQNVNFTQYQLTPSQSNPAMIATSNQTHVSLNYRNQFIERGVSFSSPMFAVSMPWLREGTRRQGAFGLTVLQDRTGENGIFTTTGGMLTASYNQFLGETATGSRYLSVGVQGSFFQQRLDVNALRTPSQWSGSEFNPNLPINENIDINQKSFGGVNAGLLYYETDSCDNVRSYIGINFQNINRANRSFLAGEKVKSPLYFTAIGGITVVNTEKLQIVPNARYIRTSQSQEIRGGVSAYYKMQGEEGKKIGVSGWYDQNGSIAMGLEMNQPKYTIGISYDMPLDVNLKAQKAAAWELALAVKLGKKCRAPRVTEPEIETIKDTLEVKVPTFDGDSIYKIVMMVNALTKEIIKKDTIQRDFRVNNTVRIPTDEDLLIFKKLGYFFYRDDEINSSTNNTLTEMVATMKKFKGIEIEIQGHSCNIGTDEENQTLSENRAKRVQKFLTDGGIDIKRIKIIGLGATVPIMSNKMEYGRIKNRRVEFKVLRKGDEK